MDFWERILQRTEKNRIESLFSVQCPLIYKSPKASHRILRRRIELWKIVVSSVTADVAVRYNDNLKITTEKQGEKTELNAILNRKKWKIVRCIAEQNHWKYGTSP